MKLSLPQRKLPCSVEDFRSGAEQSHGVVPILRDRQAIGNLSVAASKLDVDRTVGTFLRGETVQRIGMIGIGLEVAFAVVDCDRPETIDRDVLDRQPVKWCRRRSAPA